MNECELMNESILVLFCNCVRMLIEIDGADDRSFVRTVEMVLSFQAAEQYKR